MRPVLVSTFDLRESSGIGDSVLADSYARRAPSLGDVGVSNPLGWGSSLSVAADDPLVASWRTAAQAQVHREAMKDALGWSAATGESLDAFRDRLRSLLAQHPIERCELTVYSIGVAYVQLRFGPGLPLAYHEGFLNCFEFAGYTPTLSRALYDRADQHRNRSLAGKGRPLRELTRRAAPGTTVDSEGWEESGQFTYFRHVLLCIDPGDDAAIPGLLAAIDDPVLPLVFEYHGTLHYSSGLYVFASNGLDGSKDAATMARDAERILVDIEIAHVFEAVCDAFSRLILDAIRTQVDAYATDTQATPEPQRLNQLRALALAVVNLTRFDLVTPTEEDQRFFARFEAEAGLAKKHALITDAVEVLYNVQSAEEQEQSSRRANRISTVATLLASLTLISVLVDSYNFVREDQSILTGLVLRTITLVLLLAVILVLAVRLGRNR